MTIIHSESVGMAAPVPPTTNGAQVATVIVFASV